MPASSARLRRVQVGLALALAIGAQHTSRRDLVSALAPQGGDLVGSVGVPVWAQHDYRAPFASGSAGWHAMAVVPCSMGTAARIAHGTSDSLLTRAADVMLKERRTLVVVPRETPLGLIQLENLASLARAGAIVLPAMPSFYGKPATLDDLVDTVVGRVLDQLGLEHDLLRRWGAS